ncbi:hypothetical protein FACS189472_02870 [Alphaproteobacteria bacterium]|nr:hypothetical protein FACS189472_02870 [Alphaproteobacteria bacterium]
MVLAAVRAAHAFSAFVRAGLAFSASLLAGWYARYACDAGSFSLSRHPEECVARRRDPVVAPCALLVNAAARTVTLALIVALSFSENCFAKKTTAQKSEKAAVHKDVRVQKSFAVVRIEKVASRCKAGIDIEKQTTEISDQSKKGNFEELEEKIKSMEQNKTSDFDNEKIEELRLTLYEMVRTRRQQIRDAYKKALSELEDVIRNVIKSIAVRDSIGVVITSQVVLYADCRDITEDVIKEVDNVCKTIKVEIKE